MKKLMLQYKQSIERNCIDTYTDGTDNVEYWQDRLFAGAMQFSIPLSIIAVLPGIIYSLYLDLYLLAFFDLLAFLWLLWVAFGRIKTVLYRKLHFIFCLYYASSYLLYFIGIVGPGLLFLFSAAIFALLILPVRYAFWWSWINTMVCVLFAVVVHFNLSTESAINQIEISHWVAISSNLIFLSFTFSLLLPLLIKGLSGSFRKQQVLQLDLSEKNRDLEQYASIISHDLQQPLRTISGFLNLLEKKYGHTLDDKGKEYIHFAVDGSVHLQQIVNALHEFSRATRYDAEHFEQFRLEDVTNQVIQVLNEPVAGNRARIICEPGVYLQTNKAAFTQVLHNLIANALKYRKPDIPPEVEISAEDQPDAWLIKVKDNGIGIGEEYYEKIFVIFQRLHTRQQIEGTGIGLAIVKRIIEKLNGTVRVDSTPGTGSTFYFTIPKPQTVFT